MAELKSGTTIGGAVPWTKATLNLIPNGDSINYKGFKIYTENDKPTNAETDTVSASKGGEYKANVKFNEGLNSSGLIKITSQQDSKLQLVDTKDTAGYNYLEFFDKTVRKAYVGFGSTDVDTFVIRNDRGNGTLQFNNKIHFNGVQLMDYGNIAQVRGESTTLVPSVKLVSDWMETKTNKTDAENTYVKRSGSVLSGTLNFNNKAPTTYAMESHGNSTDPNSTNRLRRFRHYNSGTLYHEVVSSKGLEYYHGGDPTGFIFRLQSNGYLLIRKGISIVDNVDISGISGTVDHGSWADWRTRPSMVEVKSAGNNGASNIFKLLSSTGTPIAALDGYSTTGDAAGTTIRLVWGGRDAYFAQDKVQFNSPITTGNYTVTAGQLIATNNTDYVGVKLLKNDGYALTMETAPDNAGYVGRLIYRNPSNANISITDIPRKNGILAIQNENYTKAEADNRFAPLASFGVGASETSMKSPNFTTSTGYYSYINNDGVFGVYNRTANKSTFQVNKDGVLSASRIDLLGQIEAKNAISCSSGNILMEMKTASGYPEITTNFGSAWTNHRFQNKSGTLAHTQDHYTKAEVDSKISTDSGASENFYRPRHGNEVGDYGRSTWYSTEHTLTFPSHQKPSRVIMHMYYECTSRANLSSSSYPITITGGTLTTMSDESTNVSDAMRNKRGWVHYYIDIPANSVCSIKYRAVMTSVNNDNRFYAYFRMYGSRLSTTGNYVTW